MPYQMKKELRFLLKISPMYLQSMGSRLKILQLLRLKSMYQAEPWACRVALRGL